MEKGLHNSEIPCVANSTQHYANIEALTDHEGAA